MDVAGMKSARGRHKKAEEKDRRLWKMTLRTGIERRNLFSFMREIRSALIELGNPPRDIQYEVFDPDLWQADYEYAHAPARAARKAAKRG